MRYNIKVGERWLIGESATETIKGTVRGDTTAVFSRMVGEMSAYVFADHRKEAASFDRITLCDYLRGIVERQNYGHYLGEIKVIPEDEVEAQLPKKDGDNMSECVVRMEMPKRCYECDMANGITCMATGGVYGREVPKMTWIRRRPDWCPIICQLPEGHGRLGDLDELGQKIDRARIRVMQNGQDTNPYWESADLILQAPTIVPAEAERSET